MEPIKKDIQDGYDKVAAEYARQFINEQDTKLLTGRLGNNLLVHFPGDASLIGQIVNVKLTECKGFYYIGELCSEEY